MEAVCSFETSTRTYETAARCRSRANHNTFRPPDIFQSQMLTDSYCHIREPVTTRILPGTSRVQISV
jgi:hypothetical protein